MMISALSNQAYSGAYIATEQAAQTFQEVQALTDPKSKKASLENVLTEMAMLISALEQATASAQNNKLNLNSQIGQAITSALQTAATDIANQVKQQEYDASHQSWWDKLINALTIVVGAVLACIPGLDVIGIGMMAMGVLNLTGAMDAIQSGIAKLLEDMGMSQEVAALVTQAIMFAVAVAASVFTGGASDEAELANASKVIKAISSASKFINPVAQGLMMAPQLFADIATVALENSNMSDAEKKKIETDLSYVQMAIGIVAALVCAAPAISKYISSFRGVAVDAEKDAAAAAKDAEADTKASTEDGAALKTSASALDEDLAQDESFWEKLKKKAPKALNYAQTAYTAGSAFTGTFTGAVQAYYDFQIANAQEAQSIDQAAVDVETTLLKMNSSQNSQDVKSFENLLSSEGNCVSKLIQSIEIEGQALSQYLA